MTLRVCQGCQALFAPGVVACPQCHRTDHIEQGTTMPKIRRVGGMSNADAPAEPDLTDTDTPEEESSPGTSSSTSPEKPKKHAKKPTTGSRKPAPGAADPSKK